ncbi:hypothetical protein C427_2753 [Paraglaciecola psychrophila 170]|uniref:Uncharacterized protein n=1 Tax=Paraglaciecola psychrophila 170 TaxID=1129794 RepID=K6YU28_9ALTE|nr:hypothetical protein C427_2753 [Paraglaciecola psychrophila 170]GAC36224.1 hypothetical protein GPSY_0586 [Paraglaciecola psychrophila 170]
MSTTGKWAIKTQCLLSGIAYKKRIVEHYTVLVCYANQAVRKLSSVSH